GGAGEAVSWPLHSPPSSLLFHVMHFNSSDLVGHQVLRGSSILHHHLRSLQSPMLPSQPPSLLPSPPPFIIPVFDFVCLPSPFFLPFLPLFFSSKQMVMNGHASPSRRPRT
ncbi:unnamed protein product, partial [Phaeothamnion confervicola]